MLAPLTARCETYGIEGEDGSFVPRITVTIEDNVILIKKTDPMEKFSSISITVNPRNPKLLRNVSRLQMQWIAPNGAPGRPLPFVGPKYNRAKREFRDTMTRSGALKIIDPTGQGLFRDKDLRDLFKIRIEGQEAIPSDQFAERTQTVRLGEGRDASLSVDTESLRFDTENLKQGKMINLTNRSDVSQWISVETPSEDLGYFGVVRRASQQRIPKDQWDRFELPAKEAIALPVMPASEPEKLAALDGSEIRIQLWQGNTVRETISIPITIASDLLTGSATGMEDRDAYGPGTTDTPTETGEPPPPDPGRPDTPDSETTRAVGDIPETKPAGPVGYPMGLTAVLIANAVLVLGLAAYGIFFVMPRIQVLEDRLSKNEMFIHGSREAIREELDEIKEEILEQCRRQPESE